MPIGVGARHHALSVGRGERIKAEIGQVGYGNAARRDHRNVFYQEIPIYRDLHRRSHGQTRGQRQGKTAGAVRRAVQSISRIRRPDGGRGVCNARNRGGNVRDPVHRERYVSHAERLCRKDIEGVGVHGITSVPRNDVVRIRENCAAARRDFCRYVRGVILFIKGCGGQIVESSRGGVGRFHGLPYIHHLRVYGDRVGRGRSTRRKGKNVCSVCVQEHAFRLRETDRRRRGEIQQRRGTRSGRNDLQRTALRHAERPRAFQNGHAVARRRHGLKRGPAFHRYGGGDMRARPGTVKQAVLSGNHRL